jgi:hypothetical protein
LQRDGIADRRVLRGDEVAFIQLAGMKGAKGLAECGRAQQAPDMVGTQRWAMHGVL